MRASDLLSAPDARWLRFGRRVRNVLYVAAALAVLSFVISGFYQSRGATIYVFDSDWGTERFNTELRRAIGDWLTAQGFEKAVGATMSPPNANQVVYRGSSEGSPPFWIRILPEHNGVRVELEYHFEGFFVDIGAEQRKTVAFADLMRGWITRHVRSLPDDVAPPSIKGMFEKVYGPAAKPEAP